MHQLDFLKDLGLPKTSFPSAVRWVMESGGSVSATARLDLDPSTDQVEFGVYETVAGDAEYTTGIARFDRLKGEVTFRDDDAEAFFERFCETVRLMRVDPIDDTDAIL